MLKLVRTDSDDADLHSLVALLDEELKLRDGEPIGCGAFKQFSDAEVEIKRMFVKPDHRGKRIAGQILTELESWVLESGFTACVLETGFKQPEAIALYRRSGYAEIPNYGQYADIASSVCMRKEL